MADKEVSLGDGSVIDLGNKLGQFTELNNFSIPTTNSRFAKLSGVVYITTNSVNRIVPIGTWLYDGKRTNLYDVYSLTGKLLTTDEVGFESITRGRNAANAVS